ncbi:molybdate ABC transporter substrate-binding protein [Sandaracinobacter neustonicus]|uniref:molybdate ABC transporter substrate-binding protein n=1 Tax=Sandaracinobacter neustonicus TaxID=1715348 RepID=UPI0015E2E132|nr:molybdate ABC transporter substrate-binding protein [Sandaracinobacter neustonicus]
MPVAAAASLRYALDDAAAAYSKATGEQLRISYAASGNLVQQIEAGAPYQLFLSADEDHVFRLADNGLAPDRGRIYAVGRLVLIVPPGSPINPSLAALKAGLASGQVKRLAIANPETAPYGARSVEALKAVGLWAQAQPRLVTGENIAQAFQFVASGAADAGFTSLSLVKSPGFKGRYALVPANLHQPLTQRMVLLKSATPAARRFHDWLLSPAGQALLARHGYLPPA